jgi:hypothetical protein
VSWENIAPKTRLLGLLNYITCLTRPLFNQLDLGLNVTVLVEPLNLVLIHPLLLYSTSQNSRPMITTLDLAASSSDPVARRTLHNLSLSVAKSKRIVVVTGAGISCSCGIPVR